MATKTKSQRILRWKRGVGTSEFLVCAPIVALLATVAYDLNKRAEERQVVTILSRNAAYVGKALESNDDERRDLSQLRQTTVAQFTAMAGVLDRPELAELTGVPGPALASGMHLSVEPQQVHDSAELKSRLAAPGGVAGIGAEGSPSAYDRLSQAEGLLLSGASPLLSRAQATGSSLGLIIGDEVRVAGVEAHATGEADTIQRSAMMLERIVHNVNSDAKIPYPARIHGHGTYARMESGYHAAEYRSSAFWGMGLGYVNRSKWGAGGDFGDSADALHRRCFTRLAVSNACGTGNGGGASIPATADPQLEQDIRTRLARIEQLAKEAEDLAAQLKEAEANDESWLKIAGLRSAIKKRGESLEVASNELEAKIEAAGGTGGPSNSRHFLSKIRKLVALKIIVSVVLAIFTAGSSEQLNEQGKYLTDVSIQGLGGLVSDQITSQMSKVAGDFANPAALDDVVSQGLSSASDLAVGNAPTEFAGSLHE